jgi:hypothetical protein
MTVQQLIDAALRTLGVIATGETPSSDERTDGLTALNHMIGEWNAQALPIYQATRESVFLTGAASYALSTRPVKIQGAQITFGGMTVPVEVVNGEQWSRGGGTPSMPQLWNDAGYPNSTIYLRPAPTSGTLELQSLRPLSSSYQLSDNLALPPGYEAALRFNLAARLAPEFGRVDPAVDQRAADALTSIMGLNAAVHGSPQQPQAPPPQQ